MHSMHYGDFLLKTIESAKDQFTDEEYKKLVAGAEQIKEIEGKLTILEQKYPECAKAPGNGDSVPADSNGVVSNSSDATSFPSFDGNFYDDPRSVLFMKMADTLISKAPQEWGPDDVEHILEMFENFDAEGMMHTYALHGYYQVISDMKDLGYDSDTVQRVVKLLHEYLVGHNTEPELDGKITPQFIAKYTAPFFLGGDIAIQHERNYGKAGCLFIAQALAYYGGYDIDDL